MRKTIKIPILGIAEINARFVEKKGYRRVGLLATETTIKKDLYKKYFFKKGIDLIYPDQGFRRRLTRVIMTQLAGRITIREKKSLIEIIDNLEKKGAEAVLIACTDLPPILKQREVQVPLIDCTKVYAQEAARFSI